MSHFWRCLLVVALAVACTGMMSCDQRTRRPTGTKTQVYRTRAEYFKAKQAGTMTPHGAIDLNSIKDSADGVEYKTADGRRWRVIMEPSGNGYRMREPERID